MIPMTMHLFDDNRLSRLSFVLMDSLEARALLIVTLVVDISGTYVKQFAVTATRVLVCIYVYTQLGRENIIKPY